MIQVHVKLYANLRRYRPDLALNESFVCDVPADATVGELAGNVLGLPPEEVAIALVNGVRREREYALRDGDQIAFWSPVAGG